MQATWNPSKERMPDFPAREFPYGGRAGSGIAHYDFKLNPEQIPQVLEDFVGWNEREAVATFYGFLRWINGDRSLLETCDCAFLVDAEQTPVKPSGRVMVMYRDLKNKYDNTITIS